MDADRSVVDDMREEARSLRRDAGWPPSLVTAWERWAEDRMTADLVRLLDDGPVFRREKALAAALELVTAVAVRPAEDGIPFPAVVAGVRAALKREGYLS